MEQVIDRTAEKVALAKELGLHSWAAMQSLMGMKFKQISTREIGVMLHQGRFVWNATWMRFDSIYITSGFVGAVSSLMVVGVGYQLSDHPKAATGNIAMLTAFLGFIAGMVVPFVLSGLRRIVVERMDLCSWTDNMPYGALLAVKEAKDLGFDNFEIFYPEAREQRVMADPVITAIKNQIRFEIFSWDDGKVYE